MTDNRIQGFAWLDRVLAFCSAAPLALMVALTFADVFGRYLFARPVPGAAEVIQFAMAITIFTALPLVTRSHGHVTVDLFVHALKGRTQLLVQLPCELFSAAALAIMAWRLWIQAGEYIENHTATLVLGLSFAPLAYVMAGFAALSMVIVVLRFVVLAYACVSGAEVHP